MSALSSPAIKNRRVGGVLLQAGLVSRPEIEGLLADIDGTNDRVEDAVVELGLVTETALLKALAAHYRTRFVSTEKLSRADIPRSTLQMVSRKVAETFAMFPVVFDAKSGVLSVVTPDPEAKDVLVEIREASGAREVQPLVARPAAVHAAMSRAFAGNLHAFDALLRVEMGGRMVATSFRSAEAYSMPAPPPTLEPPPTSPTMGGLEHPRQRGPENLLEPSPPTSALPRAVERESAPMIAARARAALRESGSATMQAAVPIAPGSNTKVSIAPAVAPEEPPVEIARPPAADGTLELCRVMVTLLDQARPDLRGHSMTVARLSRRLAERMQLGPGATHATQIAAFVHDLGKMGSMHLTALNVSEYEGHKLAAQRAYGVPERLLAGVPLPAPSFAAVRHMYERYDGRGFPDGLAAKEIPLGARMLAIADTYSDLTQNPRNPSRRVLSPAEACDLLAQYKRTIFDPALVDLFRAGILGEDVRAQLEGTRTLVLVVDADPEETTVLELRLVEQGFEVKTVRTAEEAIRVLGEEPVDVVVGELDLPQGDGLELLRDAKKLPRGDDFVWIVHTRRQGRADAQTAFGLGAADFVAKPAPPDVFAAKIRALMDARASRPVTKGVSGSLSEMGLPEIVQVLFHGRKTGALKIRGGGEAGVLYLDEGRIVHATFGSRHGEDAFYAMLRLPNGDFALDPAGRAPERTINASPEALLLEGMRRLDEGIG